MLHIAFAWWRGKGKRFNVLLLPAEIRTFASSFSTWPPFCPLLTSQRWWIGYEPNWRAVINGTGNGTSLPRVQDSLNPEWGQLWQLGPKGYWQAWNEWIEGGPVIRKCLSDAAYNWPPAQ